MSVPAPAVVPFNDPARAIARDRDRLLKAAAGVLDSGRVVLGLRHSEFERALAGYLGIGRAVGVASGTDALELAFTAVMPAGKTRVVTAANAGGYSAVAARRAGFSVGWADVDESTLCLSLEQVRPAVDESTGIIVVTHLYGRLTDIRDLVRWADVRGIAVVEDCAQSIGASRAGRHGGTYGRIATTSFYPTKNLGAIGDGGAVFTDDEELADRVVQLRQYGWGSKYDVIVAGGRNSRLDELQAAFLLERLPLLEDLNTRRREIVAEYSEAARSSPIAVLPAVGSAHVAHLAVALAGAGRRDAVRSALTAKGITTDIHFPHPDYRQAGLVDASEQVPELPVTEDACARIFSLPCFPEMTDGEVDAVSRAIRELEEVES